METKANYLLIGVFTLAGIFAVFGSLLWLAKVEVNRQFTYYEVLFDGVSGLATAGDVRFNGLPVGQVISLELDADDPSKVRVRIEVGADTPVKTDTVARLEALGVTGVSYVALSGGTPAAEDLPEFGVIPSERSALQSIFEGAPEVLSKAVELLEDLQSVVSEENRTAVNTLLENLASASGRLDTTLTDFEDLSDDLGNAAREIAGFTDRLDALADTADETLTTATATLNTAQEAADTAIGTIETAREAFATADGLMQNEITDFLEKGSATAQTIDTTVSTLEPVVSEALASATETFAKANETLAAITQAMGTAETTMNTADQTFASINRVVDEDIDAIVADVREAVEVFSSTVQSVAANVEEISGEVLSASQSASDLLGTVDGVVQENRRQVSAFLRVGLPQFQRFIDESRRLVVNLERLVDRVERDPGRFLLGTQASGFRR